MNNLLISVLGNSNSGKSYTWRTLFGNSVRRGGKTRPLPVCNKKKCVDVFLINGSPQETGKFVSQMMPKSNPRIVLCSIQYEEKANNVEDAKKTYQYFIDNDYFLFVHWLNSGREDQNEKPHFDERGLVDWLLSKQSIVGIRSGKSDPHDRVEEIREYIYGWACPRNLIKQCDK